MASMKHDGLVSLFRNHPALAPELLQGPLGVALPAWSEVRVESPEFTQVVPTEYRADLVVLLRKGKPVFAIVVEVQLSRSARKRKSWPVYLTSLRARLDCPAVLLVVAPDAAVARWCAQPISLGHPGFVLQPLVAGPSSIPVILGKQEAGQSPELAVLSALAHGQEPKLAPELFEAVASSARSLDPERVTFYLDLVFSSLGEAARRALESIMKSGNYEYQSEFVRKFVAQGLEMGRQEGRQEGRQQGRQEGREEGHLEGERQALLKVLEARGLTVSAAARRRILACMEQAQLERWLGQAVTVKSVQELFQRKPTPQRASRSAPPRLKARSPRAKR
jgi:Arc/MetJ-type ribon-helix-helix transcriptional regulator